MHIIRLSTIISAEVQRRAVQGTNGMQHQIVLGGIIGISIASFTTLLRLALRIRTFWWDDALAFASLIFLLITGISGRIFYSLNAWSKTPHNSRIVLYYILAITFDLTIWTSRISILFNIIRLGRYKRRLYAAAVAFILVTAILVAQVFWVCEPQNRRTGWKSNAIPQCVLGKSVAITQVTTDAFADAVLIAVPLILLRDLDTTDAMAQRVRLAASFIIGGLTTLVSIVHAYYLWKGTQVSIVVSNAELAVSVIVCNFVVLAAAAHRLWNKYTPSLGDKRTKHSTHMEFESPTVTRATDRESGTSELATDVSTDAEHRATYIRSHGSVNLGH